MKCIETDCLWITLLDFYGVLFAVFCAVADFAFNKTDGVWNDRKNNRQVLGDTLWTSRKVDNECLFVNPGDSP